MSRLVDKLKRKRYIVSMVANKIKKGSEKMQNIKKYYGNIKRYSKMAVRIIAVTGELGAHAVAGYVLLTQFEQTLVFGVGLYLSITAGLGFAAIVIKASKQ